MSRPERRPLYQQVMEQIRQKIVTGTWAAGHRLPSIRALAGSADVSVITAKRAYMELEQEGLIVSMQGKGTFVTNDVSISTKLQREELEHHLEEAVKRARLLGMDLSELLDLVRQERVQTLKLGK
jgi:GntR family transcriptional regulator